MICSVCNRILQPNEEVTYRDRCEDCYCDPLVYKSRVINPFSMEELNRLNRIAGGYCGRLIEYKPGPKGG